MLELIEYALWKNHDIFPIYPIFYLLQDGCIRRQFKEFLLVLLRSSETWLRPARKTLAPEPIHGIPSRLYIHEFRHVMYMLHICYTYTYMYIYMQLCMYLSLYTHLYIYTHF